MESASQTPRPPRRFASRRRSRLALGGLAVAAGMSLSGCDAEPQFSDAQFTSVEACVTAGFAREVCQTGFDAARAEHQQAAPKFASQTDCEKEWGSGHCAPAASSGGSGGFFMPALAGFVVGQALQRNYYNTGSAGYYGGYTGAPIYRDRSGGSVTVDRSSGRAVTTPVNVNTRTVSSRGFGGKGKSRSSSGRSFGG